MERKFVRYYNNIIEVHGAYRTDGLDIFHFVTYDGARGSVISEFTYDDEKQALTELIKSLECNIEDAKKRLDEVSDD